MKNPSALETVFVGSEATGQADLVCFQRELGRLMGEHLIQVDAVSNVGDPLDKCSWTIVKTNQVDGLRDTDNRSKAVQKTPWRVSLDMMKQRVVGVEYIHPTSILHMTIAVVMLDNGYALVGESAPADPANFNEKLGREYAYENALKKLWPLEAYVMRDFLTDKVRIENPHERWNPPPQG